MFPTVRQPQQPRAHATRRRLLDATCDVLVSHGLAGASTSVIATRAAISQGAIFKHYPTKDDLLAAATIRILAGFVTDFADEVTRELATGSDPVAAAVAVLWRIFRRPAMRAVFEIYVAARTDMALATRLAPILAGHRNAILAQARRLFPLAAPGPELDGAVDAIVYSMQGAAIGLFSPDPAAEVEHLAFLERLARRELERLQPVTQPRKRA